MPHRTARRRRRRHGDSRSRVPDRRRLHRDPFTDIDLEKVAELGFITEVIDDEIPPEWEALIGSTSYSPSAPPDTVPPELEEEMVMVIPPARPEIRPGPSQERKAREAMFPQRPDFVCAQRPGFGTVGTRTRIRCNMFEVEICDRNLYRYQVSVTPEVSSPLVKRAIMKELTWSQGGKETLSGLQIAYDGEKNLYTAGPLPFESNDFVVKQLVDEVGPRWKMLKYKVTIKFVSRIELNHLREFLSGRENDAPLETIRLFEAVLKESPSNNFNVIGGAFFSAGLESPVDIGNGVECGKGFYQSLRRTQMGMSLSIDVTAAPFYGTNVRVHEFVKNYLNCWDTSVPGSVSPLSPSACSELNKVLKGVKVKATHGGERCYIITELSTQPTNQLMFHKDGSEKSVVDYFEERYGIMLNYDSWPSLQCGSDTKPIYLPMEICRILEGQRYVKRLNNKQITAMRKVACEQPSNRAKKTHRIARLNRYEEGGIEHEFGIDVKNDFTYIDARVLPPPILQYHDSGKDRTITPHLGQWNMNNARMFHGATVMFWRCVNFSSLPEDVASRFCRDLVEMCDNKGMHITPDPMAPIVSVEPDQVENALVDAHDMCSKEGKAMQLLIIILPDFTGGSYGIIKRKCETELGIITQCCQPDQAKKCDQQYLENVALKMNAKIGGINTVLYDAFLGRIPLGSDRPTIIFGADVTHPQPGEDYSASIAAVVASVDWPCMAKYKALVSAQQHSQEIIQDLYKVEQEPGKEAVHSGMIRELLIGFRRITGRKPLRIIFFRDGVSEGQFSQVLLHEMDAIRKACASLETTYFPPVTYVVVQKRHHTRLFLTNPSESENVLPGTVVDTKICHPTGYDFYLCSHAATQGTSQPAHYHVLLDENNFSPDQFQTLTNNLCYTYATCTSSISVVPPVRYARLAAERARCYMEGDCGASESEPGIGVMKEAASVRPLPALCPNIKDYMFFC